MALMCPAANQSIAMVDAITCSTNSLSFYISVYPTTWHNHTPDRTERNTTIDDIDTQHTHTQNGDGINLWPRLKTIGRLANVPIEIDERNSKWSGGICEWEWWTETKRMESYGVRLQISIFGIYSHFGVFNINLGSIEVIYIISVMD